MKKKTERVEFRADADLVADAEGEAALADMSLGAYVRRALREQIRRDRREREAAAERRAQGQE